MTSLRDWIAVRKTLHHKDFSFQTFQDREGRYHLRCRVSSPTSSNPVLDDESPEAFARIIRNLANTPKYYPRSPSRQNHHYQ